MKELIIYLKLKYIFFTFFLLLFNLKNCGENCFIFLENCLKKLKKNMTSWRDSFKQRLSSVTSNVVRNSTTAVNFLRESVTSETQQFIEADELQNKKKKKIKISIFQNLKKKKNLDEI